MTVTFVLREIDGGTEVVAEHAGVPSGVAPEDNELGWRMSFAELARLVETTAGARRVPDGGAISHPGNDEGTDGDS